MIESGMEYVVSIQYYCVNESEDEEDTEISLLDENEVNIIIDEKFSKEKEDETSVSDENKGSKRFTLMDSSALTSFSSTKAITDTETSPSGMFKQTLIVTQTSIEQKVQISYTGYWVTSPSNRKTDVVCVYLKNATPVKSTVNANYTATYLNIDSSTGSYSVNNYSTNLSNSVKVTTNSVSLSYAATIDQFYSWNYMAADAEYYHQECTISVDPTVSIGVNGTLYFSASVQKKMHDMTPNVAVTFYYNK